MPELGTFGCVGAGGGQPPSATQPSSGRARSSGGDRRQVENDQDHLAPPCGGAGRLVGHCGFHGVPTCWMRSAVLAPIGARDLHGRRGRERCVARSGAGRLPADRAALKLIYVALCGVERKWRAPLHSRRRPPRPSSVAALAPPRQNVAWTGPLPVPTWRHRRPVT